MIKSKLYDLFQIHQTDLNEKIEEFEHFSIIIAIFLGIIAFSLLVFIALIGILFNLMRNLSA